LKVVIIGAGEVGFHVASHLALENKDVVVIDRDQEALRRVSDNIDAQTVNGEGSNPGVLEEAGVKHAEFIIAVTDSDQHNLVACLMADIISPKTKKLARLSGADFDKYGAHFCSRSPNIDTIINPEIEVVNTIESLMNVPGAVDVGEFAGGRVKFVGIYLDKTARVAGIRLSELPDIINRPAPLIAAIVREEKLIIPKGTDRLASGDLIYFISENDNLLDTLSLFGKHAEPVNNVLIIGGGSIGFRLASRLEEKPVYTKIIEKRPDRCTKLAEQLNKAVILHGDGSDQEILSEENIREMDLVVTLTEDEETNILTSLLVKRMGAQKNITRVSKLSYFPLMNMIGLKQIVSPQLSAVNTILQHIRQGRVLSVISLKGDQAEVIEAIAMESSEIVGRPLKDIAIPSMVLITGVIRKDKDKVVIPSGSTIIGPGDRIIMFAKRQAIPKIEKLLSVKLELF
jgi:trk system potassium uptake protein